MLFYKCQWKKHISYKSMSHKIFLHKTPDGFPVFNLKTKHSRLVSIATDELIIHPFGFFWTRLGSILFLLSHFGFAG